MIPHAKIFVWSFKEDGEKKKKKGIPLPQDTLLSFQPCPSKWYLQSNCSPYIFPLLYRLIARNKILSLLDIICASITFMAWKCCFPLKGKLEIREVQLLFHNNQGGWSGTDLLTRWPQCSSGRESWKAALNGENSSRLLAFLTTTLSDKGANLGPGHQPDPTKLLGGCAQCPDIHFGAPQHTGDLSTLERAWEDYQRRSMVLQHFREDPLVSSSPSWANAALSDLSPGTGSKGNCDVCRLGEPNLHLDMSLSSLL